MFQCLFGPPALFYCSIALHSSTLLFISDFIVHFNIGQSNLSMIIVLFIFSFLLTLKSTCILFINFVRLLTFSRIFFSIYFLTFYLLCFYQQHIACQIYILLYRCCGILMKVYCPIVGTCVCSCVYARACVRACKNGFR